MATKTAIKEEMDFNTTMKQMVDVLKGIAAAAFQTLRKKKKEKFTKFDTYFTGFFQMADLIGAKHPVLQVQSDTVGVIAVTAEAGFMGALNAKICNMSLAAANEGKSAEIMVIGKRGAAKMKGSGHRITVFPAIDEKKRYEQAVKIKDYAIKQTVGKRIGRLVLVYANPISFTLQKVERIDLLPAEALFKDRDKFRVEPSQSMCVESSFEAIVEYLVGTWITIKLFETFFDSKLSEYAAQSVQLEGSLQYLEDEGKKLKLKYNKARREAVDSEMREVFSAMLAIKG